MNEYVIVGISTIIIMVLIVSLIVSIGVYVYGDAQKRGLDPLVWTLVVLLVPNLIGFIIYLIVRSNKEPMNTCNNCGGFVKESYHNCPYCGEKQEINVCPSCNHVVETNWKVCPHCSNQLVHNHVEKQDKGMDKALKRIIALFIALIGVGIISMVIMVITSL